MDTHKPFLEPIYTTRPMIPDLKAVESKLREIWESQWLTNNAHQHQRLEEKIREYLNVPAVSLFNNGTTALLVAIQSLNLSKEVITTPFTFPATPHALTWNDITPVFADIDPVTMNIDPDSIEKVITPRTTAILATHIFGVPCDVARIQEIADCHGLKVVYDAAHAFGTEIDGRGIGQFGDLTMFSFHATKLFHTLEGGALAINDTNAKRRIDLLKNFGIKDEEAVISKGINGKMNEIQAAIGLILLEQVEEERRKREVLLQTYREHLSGIEGVSFVENNENVTNSYQYFAIRINEKLFGMSRDEVARKFKEYNVLVRKYFYPLCSDYDCYRHLSSASPERLPVATTVAKESLTLPFYGGLLPEDVEKICSLLVSFKGTNMLCSK